METLLVGPAAILSLGVHSFWALSNISTERKEDPARTPGTPLSGQVILAGWWAIPLSLPSILQMSMHWGRNGTIGLIIFSP